MLVDNYQINTKTYQGSFLWFEYGSNGLKGGDSGHGSRTIINIESIGADMRLNNQSIDNIQMIFGGDYELLDIINGFEQIVKELKQINKEKKDENF